MLSVLGDTAHREAAQARAASAQGAERGGLPHLPDGQTLEHHLRRGGIHRRHDRHGRTARRCGTKGWPRGTEADLLISSKTRAKEKPFFVWYAPLLPHDPHTPPERLLAKYRGQGPTPAAEKYYAMVEWFDETCGKLDDYLAKDQLTENTVIL